MTSKNENKENEYENAKKYIKNLINENKYRQKQLSEKMKSYHNELTEKESIIKSIIEEKADISKMLSPNSRDYNIEEYEENIRNLKKKIEETGKEKEATDNSIIQLENVLNILNQQKSQIDMRLNILEIQEQDRQRIARDLHDSTVQNLTSLIHKCELSAKFVDTDPVRTRLELLTISSTLKSVINEIREIIFNLKPMSLDDLGLILTIERFINQLMNHHDIDIKLTYNEERNDILPVINLSIFRVIQEACNNAIKHANAKCIEIDIQYGESNVNITIKDDGKGFDTKEIKDRITRDYTGCGLSIMKERVYLLSGTLDIQSTINKGTIINISVPYSCKGEDQ